MAQEKRIATTLTPSIEAAITQLWRMPDEAAILRKLNQISEHFVVSRLNISESQSPHVILWIKGYGVSEEELRKGWLGHFAVIAPKQLADGRYTLTATKVELPLDMHPQRKYQAIKQRHPNWGHPVLRKVKKGAGGFSLEEAALLLMRLHEDYPETTIPGEMKLYVMIYHKADKNDKPIKKWLIEALPEEGGTYRLSYRENETRKKGGKTLPETAIKEVVGRFTAKAVMKKKRR